MYGLFAICGYQFAPRRADVTDTQLWWLPAIVQHWDGMVRVAGRRPPTRSAI
ncbi:hypothetical protein SMD20_47680 [Nonomuraea sp. LP-02]|uniref:hypothetical protein n=1 Tax=Nonomuraea sp. LP-02 TaxID=3097960 RepID=UPI002E330C8C|nr:hypothetical protein [Nonomuraea sp. LP-02]MED7931974.1 hypothetical protein [Nonomuraea sp. LP-02]